MMYSINHPTVQNYQNNACFYVKGEDLMLGTRCQYFIAHVPGFTRDRGSISLESYCKRGYFLRQKKYGYILAQTHASLNFGKYATRTSNIINTIDHFISIAPEGPYKTGYLSRSYGCDTRYRDLVYLKLTASHSVFIVLQQKTPPSTLVVDRSKKTRFPLP